MAANHQPDHHLSEKNGIPDSSTTDLGVAFRGLLMGLAEVVPGVSGGTMAFITGIYPTLVRALASFGVASLPMMSRPARFFVHHNLRFLLVLAAGMGLGILLFAKLMQYLLAHYQPLVWAFFGGVIAVSAVVIGKVRQPAKLLSWGPPGLLMGLSLMWLPALTGEPGLGLIFIGGAVAVCAWLLPAVSGSYVLLALGLYGPVIEALAGLDIPLLTVLGLGCAVGVLAFAKLLSWLLHRYSEALLSLLTGFMLGSLPKLWPWQESGPSQAWQGLLTPDMYETSLGTPAFSSWAVVVFVSGGIALWLLTRLSRDA